MGLLTVERVLSSVLVLPAVFVGAWLGHRVQLRVDESSFRRLVALALIILGLLLLIG
jgi:uncharacterized membrane protein YfcA